MVSSESNPPFNGGSSVEIRESLAPYWRTIHIDPKESAFAGRITSGGTSVFSRGPSSRPVRVVPAHGGGGSHLIPSEG